MISTLLVPIRQTRSARRRFGMSNVRLTSTDRFPGSKNCRWDSTENTMLSRVLCEWVGVKPHIQTDSLNVNYTNFILWVLCPLRGNDDSSKVREMWVNLMCTYDLVNGYCCWIFLDLSPKDLKPGTHQPALPKLQYVDFCLLRSRRFSLWPIRDHEKGTRSKECSISLRTVLNTRVTWLPCPPITPSLQVIDDENRPSPTQITTIRLSLYLTRCRIFSQVKSDSEVYLKVPLKFYRDCSGIGYLGTCTVF